MGRLQKFLIEKLQGRDELAFSWRTLYLVLEARVFANLYIWLLIVPWLVNLTSHLPPTVSLTPFNSSPAINLQLSLPFSWYVLYFSGVSFVLARLVYLYFCPRFLRQFDNAGDAKSHGLTVQYIGNESRDFLVSYFRKPARVSDAELDRLADIFQRYYIDDAKISVFRSMKIPIGPSIRDALERVVVKESPSSPSHYTISEYGPIGTVEKEQFFKQIFWDLHRFQDFAYPVARGVCTFLIAVGSILFAAVAVQGLVYVLKQILTST